MATRASTFGSQAGGGHPVSRRGSFASLGNQFPEVPKVPPHLSMEHSMLGLRKYQVLFSLHVSNEGERLVFIP